MTTVDLEHDGLVVVPWHDEQVLLVLSARETTVRGGPGGTVAGAVAAVAIDVDGDGSRELVTCGPTGVVVSGWEVPREPQGLSDQPCTEIAASATLLMAGRAAWTLPGPLPRGPIVVGVPSQLASDGRELWVASPSPTGHTVSRFGPDGIRVFTVADEVQALVPGAWTVAGALEGPDGPIATRPGVGAVAGGDGVWVVAYPASGSLGIVTDGPEQAVESPVPPVHLVVGDLDGDGVTEAVVGDGHRVAVVPLAGEVVPDAPPPPPPPTTRALGMRFPGFAGTDGVLASGRSPARSQVSTALGLAMGSTLAPRRGIGGSPSFAMAFEQRMPVGRAWWGFDTAPLLVQAGDTIVWEGLLLSTGATFGGPHVRSGPFVSAGLIGAGGGWRAVLTPFESRGGTLRGVEARITLLVGPSVSVNASPVPTGSVSLMYVGTTQVGWHRGRTAPTDVSPPPDPLRRGPVVCREVSLGIGVAGGVSSTRLSWEYIGQNHRLEGSVSPALSAGCETGAAALGWYAGLETAPTFAWRIPWDEGHADQVAHHMGSGTFGIVTGSETVRFGPIVTAGIWALGGGARLLVAPIRSGGGASHGLEFRAEVLVPSAPSVEAMVLYTTTFDPRRGKIHER